MIKYRIKYRWVTVAEYADFVTAREHALYLCRSYPHAEANESVRIAVVKYR